MAATGFVSALIAGAIFGLVGLIFLDGLVGILGATPTIAPYARQYAMYILIGAPFMASSLVLNNQLRFQGSAFLRHDRSWASGAVLNIALDPLLIFVLDMGVSRRGAGHDSEPDRQLRACCCDRRAHAAATSSISLEKLLARAGRAIRKSPSGGTPSLFRQGLGSVATICLNFAAGIYGDAAIAGMSIVTRVLQFANSAIIGLGQGFQPVCGFNYGAKLYGRVRKAFWFTVSLAFCVLLIGSIVGIAFAPQIIAIFRKEDLEVIKIGALSLRLQCIFLPLSAFVVGCEHDASDHRQAR